MTAARLCPQCAKPLASDAPQGLCPECLLKAALPGQSALESAATGLHHDESTATSTVSPEAGARLKYFGDYELLDEIARGGMGVVWKARQTSLKRTVAVKMIRAGALASPDEVQRFLREAEAAANLQHPNIVAIHEVGEHGGQHYFSMDYVAGRDLGALVHEGPLPPQRAAHYVKIIAEAIHFAHQRGTLHRDLKPQNVLIDAADQPRITDFGLAKILEQDSRLTESGVVMGSPSYMPPEQAAGRHDAVGPHSDVYSLGAILYELLTGRPPFRAATPLATLRLVMEAEPAEPRRLKNDIPPDLETICLKCLEKSPSLRYPSARELAEDLGRFLHGEPIHARPASVVRKAVSWGRRHPGVLAAAAALLMLGLTFGGLYLFEENAFLRAQQADPTLKRQEGPRNAARKSWQPVVGLAMWAGLFTFFLATRRAQGAPWKEWLERSVYYRPLGPMGEGMRTFAACVGLACIGCSLAYLVKVIQADVWEGIDSGVGWDIWRAFPAAWCGLWLLSRVVGDYQLAVFGPSTRELRPEHFEHIRQALLESDALSAVRLYRQAVPDAGLKEASDYVQELAAALKAQFPEKFETPALSLATLNWSAVVIWLFIEAVMVGLAWVVFAPEPVGAAIHFAAGLLFGLGVMAALRLKKRWKQLLVLAASLAAGGYLLLFGSELGVRGEQTWPFLIGLACGASLMLSAYTPRRREIS